MSRYGESPNREYLFLTTVTGLPAEAAAYLDGLPAIQRPLTRASTSTPRADKRREASYEMTQAAYDHLVSQGWASDPEATP